MAAAVPQAGRPFPDHPEPKALVKRLSARIAERDIERSMLPGAAPVLDQVIDQRRAGAPTLVSGRDPEVCDVQAIARGGRMIDSVRRPRAMTATPPAAP